jgi:tRNA threonylcarbamoyladenosine biosynthesis protein TsaB
LSYLFIDSTYDLTLGVLDDGLRWLSFERMSGQKASAIIQAKAHEHLLQHKLKANELTGIITIHGPGFYTGLRLAEGFADVFNFFGVKQYSFYSYEIPSWCGFEQGIWFTKAYRGEYFFYCWNKQTHEQKLLPSKELAAGISGEQFFIHSEASLDALSTPLIKNPIRTTDLLKEHPEKIFGEVIKGLKREPFYFRAPEDEFKVNP